MDYKVDREEGQRKARVRLQKKTERPRQIYKEDTMDRWKLRSDECFSGTGSPRSS